MNEKIVEYFLLNGYSLLELIDEKRFFIYFTIDFPQKTNISYTPFLQIYGFEITSLLQMESNFSELVLRILDRKKLRFKFAENAKYITYEN